MDDPQRDRPPLVCCHGGPGFWDTFGGLARAALLGHSWGPSWPCATPWPARAG